MSELHEEAIRILQDLPRSRAEWFHDPDGIHGVGHTQRVMVHAVRLCDSERLGEDILLAAEYHSQGDEWGERATHWFRDPRAALLTYRVLKDADALERVRLGGTWEVDPGQLRFEWSRGQIEVAWELYRGWQ